jgi:hypothetical protein
MFCETQQLLQRIIVIVIQTLIIIHLGKLSNNMCLFVPMCRHFIQFIPGNIRPDKIQEKYFIINIAFHFVQTNVFM